MTVDLSRRTVIFAAASFVGCFVLGGGVKAIAAEGDFLRPPGGQDEARLRELCLKCDRCRSICPHDIIEPVTIEENILDARTPKLDFHLGDCDYCGLCQQVCPTKALAPDFDPSRERLGTARLDTSMCLAYSSFCEQCKDSCPYGALSFDQQNHPVVDESLCNGCGACVYACQSNVAGLYSGHERALEVYTEGAGL